MKEITCLLVIHFLILTFGALDKNKAGPFDVIVERLDYCPGYENEEYHYTYKLKKFNRTTVAIDADVEITTPFENNMKFTLIMDQFANNGWKENFFKTDFIGSICDTIKSYAPKFAARMFEVAKVKDCPIPEGNFSITNFPLLVEIKEVPVFFYNKYRNMFIIEKNNKRLVCFMAYAEFVPKRLRKG